MVCTPRATCLLNTQCQQVFFRVASISLVRSSSHRITTFMSYKLKFEISMMAKLVARLEIYGQLSKVILISSNQPFSNFVKISVLLIRQKCINEKQVTLKILASKGQNWVRKTFLPNANAASPNYFCEHKIRIHVSYII